MKSWRVSDTAGNVKDNWAELIKSVPESEGKTKKPAKSVKPTKEPPELGYTTED